MRTFSVSPTMPKRTTGRYERTRVGGEEVAAFVPYDRLRVGTELERDRIAKAK